KGFWRSGPFSSGLRKNSPSLFQTAPAQSPISAETPLIRFHRSRFFPQTPTDCLSKRRYPEKHRIRSSQSPQESDPYAPVSESPLSMADRIPSAKAGFPALKPLPAKALTGCSSRSRSFRQGQSGRRGLRQTKPVRRPAARERSEKPPQKTPAAPTGKKGESALNPPPSPDF